MYSADPGIEEFPKETPNFDSPKNCVREKKRNCHNCYGNVT